MKNLVQEKEKILKEFDSLIKWKDRWIVVNDYKPLRDFLSDKFDSYAQSVCAEKVQEYRDQILIDKEVADGKDWYDKNYWMNRLLDQLQQSSEKENI